MSSEQIDDIKEMIKNMDDWVDDYTVDRLAYYFNGEITFSDDEAIYYFSYEYNVMYYEHYFAEIPDEQMPYIKDIASENSIIQNSRTFVIPALASIRNYLEEWLNENLTGCTMKERNAAWGEPSRQLSGMYG